jgi:NAD(P)-dependent dehydrogenase (short-subunit alcohol dehydrogenase family)
VIDTNLTGMWHACKAAISHLVEGGRGGSIVIISSTGGLKGIPKAAHYSSAKHGVVGLMRTLELELAPHFIRVNSVHRARSTPTSSRTKPSTGWPRPAWTIPAGKTWPTPAWP